MLGGAVGASAMVADPFILPTVILVTIVLAWAIMYRYAKPAVSTLEALDMAEPPPRHPNTTTSGRAAHRRRDPPATDPPTSDRKDMRNAATTMTTGSDSTATNQPTPDDGVSLFLVVLTYTQPLEEIEVLLPEHRRWLDEHYARGTFLASGPRVPRDGGVILARGHHRADLEALTRTDPFARAGVATYDLIEFRLNRGPFAASLLAGETPGSTEPHGPSPTARPTSRT